MSQNAKLSAALVIACAALALAAYGALRGPGASPSGQACVDQQARDQTEQLRRQLAERDAMIARLARATNAATSLAPPADPPPSSPSPKSSSDAASTADGPRFYAHFEVPNPAVTVTQKPNGTYDIRTTDRKLSGTTMSIKASTEDGHEDTLLIRIP